ncbi:SDR family oxidoreductase [Rhizobium changzhiense]|uniref:UDP-glucuronic acid decarboxylase family protein n=1 Tax=Rhizobium changzhiense TaxID=2692317 RepID=UPI001F0B72CF|nr:UDP-glucuronic acid decarboxylase family protein [Rhizobium changzhiense]MCH4547474.1 SDR family oxidoreductase [Rhizobium changzhiense]
MSGKAILVAGGAGFLGARLCEKLLARGDHITCLDNFQTGRLEAIDHLIRHKNFKILRQSVTEPVTGEFDEIFNLASPASPPQYQRDPIGTFTTNVLGTLALLKYATEKGAKILQASTSEVYGDPLVHPQTETYFGNVNCTGVRACYDEGKRGAEALIYDFHRVHRTNSRVARIFNTYGPGMDPDDGRVVSNFIVQALRGSDITIDGDGCQTRSFCYRDDLVDGLICLMDAQGPCSEPINLGNPNEMRVKDLAHLILRLTGSKSVLTFRDAARDDPKQRCPDISRAKSILNWQPSTPLEEGLIKTINYFEGKVGRALSELAGQL